MCDSHNPTDDAKEVGALYEPSRSEVETAIKNTEAVIAHCKRLIAEGETLIKKLRAGLESDRPRGDMESGGYP